MTRHQPDQEEEMQLYWLFYDDMTVIDCIVMKDRRIVVPAFIIHIERRAHTKNPKTATLQSHGHIKNETTGMRIHLLG